MSTPATPPGPAAPPETAPRAGGAGRVVLEARGLGKRYPTATGGLTVLDGADVEVRAGELVAVVGESGTGKSTLLHLLGALDRPTAGTVRYRPAPDAGAPGDGAPGDGAPGDGAPGDGWEDVFALDDEALAAFRNRAIGFVFQFHHLLPEFDAVENVAMPALIAGGSVEEAAPRAHELLRGLGLGDRLTHRPSQLSGGEQQRVAVARALMNRPGLVLMDEPSGNLDTRTAERLHDELRRLSRADDQAFVVVTHNPTLAALADRTLTLEGGRLMETAG